MLIKIDKKEREIWEKACALLTCDVKFYTIETNDSLLQAEITDMGREIALTTACRIGNLVGADRHHRALYDL